MSRKWHNPIVKASIFQGLLFKMHLLGLISKKALNGACRLVWERTK